MIVIKAVIIKNQFLVIIINAVIMIMCNNQCLVIMINDHDQDSNYDHV